VLDQQRQKLKSKNKFKYRLPEKIALKSVNLLLYEIPIVVMHSAYVLVQKDALKCKPSKTVLHPKCLEM